MKNLIGFQWWMELLMLKFVVTSDCQEFPHICSSGSLCCSCHMSTLSQIATDMLERMTGNVDFSPSPRFPTLPTYHILHKQILHDLLTGLELLIRPNTAPEYCSACSVNILWGWTCIVRHRQWQVWVVKSAAIIFLLPPSNGKPDLTKSNEMYCGCSMNSCDSM